MNKKLNIKILVGYHKPAVLLKSDVLVPIHLGRALATEASKDGKMSQEDYQWMLDNMIGDDTGDNISAKNREFCELTGIYWAWKNYDKLGNPDYIGFMHYRRHFIFEDHDYSSVNVDAVPCTQIDDTYLNFVNFSADNIRLLLKDYDLIQYAPLVHKKTVFQQFEDLANPKYNLDFEIWKKSINILKEIFPNYAQAADEYLNQHKHLWFNMFVMKKELFFEYANWIFTIQKELENKIDLNFLSVKGRRVLAFILERFYGIFIYAHQNNLKSRKLKITMLDYPECQDVVPAFQNNNIPIVMSADNNYVFYLATSIYSLIKNSSKQYNYDIMILEEGITESNKRIIKTLQKSNVKIRFINMNRFLTNVDKNLFYLIGTHTYSTYFRFYVPTIFKNYDKILYLDCDSVILSDVSELFFTDLSNFFAAACIDIGVLAHMSEDEKFKNYVTNILKLKNPYEYFQAGVMVLNIKKLIECNIQDKLFEALKEIKTPRFVDQDILNCVFYKKVKFLDAKWNVEWNLPFDFKFLENKLPANIYEEYNVNREHPYFLHYSGKKPWNLIHTDLAEIFWSYAQQTPFYSRLIIEVMKKQILTDYNMLYRINKVSMPIWEKEQREICYKIINFQQNQRKKIKYKFLAMIMFGKKKKMYKQKYEILKQDIKEFKKFLKKRL